VTTEARQALIAEAQRIERLYSDYAAVLLPTPLMGEMLMLIRKLLSALTASDTPNWKHAETVERIIRRVETGEKWAPQAETAGHLRGWLLVSLKGLALALRRDTPVTEATE